MSNSSIAVESLRKTYRDGWWSRRPVEALRGVSLTVEPGEIFGLLGPNGAGKTTFVKILLGIIRRTGGSAVVLGQPAGSRESRRHIGYLPEHLRLPRHQTAHTALEYYGMLSGLSAGEVRRRRDAVLDLVGLVGWERESVRKYSKGMLQRLGLAQALLHDPQLLILDEPTDGLDPIGRSQVRTVLTRLRSEGKTIFLNSHLLQEVELVCDRVAILAKGEVRYVGSAGDLTHRHLAASAIEYEFEVQGAESAVRQALPGRDLLRVQSAGERLRFALPLAETADVDDCVDALRRAGVSLIGLARRRATLEDAFLHLVDAASQEPQRATISGHH